MYTNFEAVQAIQESVDIVKDWDVANSDIKLHFNILKASQNVGRFEPFTEAEKALNRFLKQKMAGPKLCDYAWRTLAASHFDPM